MLLFWNYFDCTYSLILVAETSLTLNDVVFVIDGGRENQTRYDPISKTAALVECWVAKVIISV